MSISTHIHFRNANDPRYLKAINGTPEQRQAWEEDEGRITDRPGAPIELEEGAGYEETDDEYGGWIIAVADIPKDATHIVIARC